MWVRSKSLRRLEIHALASFAADGMLEYVAKVGLGNNRTIDTWRNDGRSGIQLYQGGPQIREVPASRLEGRFDDVLALGTGILFPRLLLYCCSTEVLIGQ